MNVEQFTNKVKEQISAAQIKALQMQHQQLLPLHMLGALLEEKDIVVPLLQQTGTNLSKLQNDIDKEIEKVPSVIQQDKPNIFISQENRVGFVFRRSFEESKKSLFHKNTVKICISQKSFEESLFFDALSSISKT